MTKPVQVFILMGQSNMVGLGKITGGEGSLENAVKTKKLYPYLVDEAGAWAERKDVRFVRMMQGKGLLNNEWMAVKAGTIGPEFGIANPVGNAIEAPVMILKSCIGNRSLGWDLLPPGTEPYEFEGKMVPGYRGTPDNPKGDGSKPTAWYAGKQYDDDTDDAKKVLADLATYFPDAKKYEVAGFFFWQGEKDCGSPENSARYEKNLVAFIKQLRKDFNAPNSKFVLATLGEATKGSKGNGGLVLDAQLAVDGTSGKYPEFKGNVATVYSNPLSKGGSGNGHYGGNAETYMEVGQAMGKAMVDLMKSK
ncbi:MAG: sialate O-acetylesterase [Verrucomicrobiales bacterium VVV1]|nr:MAG: sialate O-acetylesterase [Verrucomicrobiales bacterium VVV1]